MTRHPLQGARFALALWANSTLGLLVQANHANSVQEGRGIGNKGMLETLSTLDMRNLESWQLDEARIQRPAVSALLQVCR